MTYETAKTCEEKMLHILHILRKLNIFQIYFSFNGDILSKSGRVLDVPGILGRSWCLSFMCFFHSREDHHLLSGQTKQAIQLPKWNLRLCVDICDLFWVISLHSAGVSPNSLHLAGIETLVNYEFWKLAALTLTNVRRVNPDVQIICFLCSSREKWGSIL